MRRCIHPIRVPPLPPLFTHYLLLSSHKTIFPPCDEPGVRESSQIINVRAGKWGKGYIMCPLPNGRSFIPKSSPPHLPSSFTFLFLFFFSLVSSRFTFIFTKFLTSFAFVEMFFSTSILATLFAAGQLLSLVQAHVEMQSPIPFRSKFLLPNGPNTDFSMTSPLNADGSNFPCKGYQKDTLAPTATLTAGESFTLQYRLHIEVV